MKKEEEKGEKLKGIIGSFEARMRIGQQKT